MGKRSALKDAPAYTLRPKTEFGKPFAACTSAKSRPEVTSKNVVKCLDNVLVKSPSWTIFGKPSPANSHERSPGPDYHIPAASGIYSHPCIPKPPLFLFGSGERSKQIIKASPGPGQYNVSKRNASSSTGWTIMSRPLEVNRSGLRPDPATYKVNFNHLARCAAYTFNGRQSQSETKVSTEIPGPGEYRLSFKYLTTEKETPKWGFSMSKRF